MGTILEIENLKIGYARSGKVLLSDLIVSVPAGQLISLLGLNGSGKTTLLRTLAGQLPPLAGELRFNGHARPSPLERAMLMAMVGTDRQVPALMLAYDLVALGRSPYTGLLGRLSKEDHRQVQRALAHTGASALAQRRMGDLSDGEKQKVLLARAIAQDTDMILLDEPNTYLDLKNRVMIFQQLLRLKEEMGKTILLSTHDLQLALELSDTIWLLDGMGKLHKGSPAELVEAGIIAQVFEDSHIAFNAQTRTFTLKDA